MFGSSGHAATPFEGVTAYTMGYFFWYHPLEDRYYNADNPYPNGPIIGYWGLRGTPITNPYVFYGFSSPVDNLPIMNDAKAGQTIPVKWRITDINGAPISDPASFKNLASYKITCDSLSGDSTSSIEEYATGSSGLQYIGDGSWHFNWTTSKTYAGQCRKMVLTLGEGSTYEADFKFK